MPKDGGNAVYYECGGPVPARCTGSSAATSSGGGGYSGGYGAAAAGNALGNLSEQAGAALWNGVFGNPQQKADEAAAEAERQRQLAIQRENARVLRCQKAAADQKKFDADQSELLGQMRGADSGDGQLQLKDFGSSRQRPGAGQDVCASGKPSPPSQTGHTGECGWELAQARYESQQQKWEAQCGEGVGTPTGATGLVLKDLGDSPRICGNCYDAYSKNSASCDAGAGTFGYNACLNDAFKAWKKCLGPADEAECPGEMIPPRVKTSASAGALDLGDLKDIAPPHTPPSPPPAGSSVLWKALEMKGDVSFVTRSGRKLTPGEMPNGADLAGATVQTGLHSAVKLRLPDDTTFKIGPGSKLVLDEFVYDPKTGATKKVVSMSKGVFRWVTGEMSKAKTQAGAGASEETLHIPAGDLGIRGTDFETSIDPSGAGRVRLFSGALEVKPKKDAKPFPLAGGHEVRFGADGRFGPVSRLKSHPTRS